MMQTFFPPEFCNAHTTVDLLSFTSFPTATYILSSIMRATGSSSISCLLDVLLETPISWTLMESALCVIAGTVLTIAMILTTVQLYPQKNRFSFLSLSPIMELNKQFLKLPNSTFSL